METIYSRLRSWRSEQARQLNVPSFFILSNAHLAGVAAARPATMDELSACAGLGPKRLAQFGQALLEVLLQCQTEGLEPGVVQPQPEPEPVEPPLTEEAITEIGAALRKEWGRWLARRFKGRYTPAQVEEALRRLSCPA
jgi:ribonuclease D